MKTGGFEIGHDTEVAQGAKASGQTLSELDQTVNRLDGAIGKPSFQEGDNTAPMFLNALCQLAEGLEPAELGALAPPAQSFLIFIGEDILKRVAQNTPCSGQLLRGTRASKRHWSWKKFRCLQRLMLVSWVGQSLPHCGHPKRLPCSKSNFRSNRRGSPSNRHSVTFHPASSCKAAVNNASGVIAHCSPLEGIYKGRQ